MSVLFAGGGTGGHIYPAIAIAEQLRQTDPTLPIRFLVSQRDVDARILTGAGYDFTQVPARPPSIRPVALLRFVASWGRTVRVCREAIRAMTSARRRTVLVSTGGFVAAPAVVAARAEQAPRVVISLDAVPGKATRFAAGFAGVRLNASGADLGSRWTPVGPLIRRAARADAPAADARRRFDLAPDVRTLLITGGSQGASSINEFMAAFADAHADALASWQVIHQTGDEAASEALALLYRQAGARAHVTPFTDRMGDAWAAADLALGRAGAGTVAEARASATPALFLPYPHHRDEHQRRNAAPLENAGAAIIVRDRVNPEANLANAGDALSVLLGDDAKRAAMANAYAKLGSGDGAPKAASVIKDLLATA